MFMYVKKYLRQCWTTGGNNRTNKVAFSLCYIVQECILWQTICNVEFTQWKQNSVYTSLTLKVLVATIEARWEGIGG